MLCHGLHYVHVASFIALRVRDWYPCKLLLALIVKVRIQCMLCYICIRM